MLKSQYGSGSMPGTRYTPYSLMHQITAIDTYIFRDIIHSSVRVVIFGIIIDLWNWTDEVWHEVIGHQLILNQLAWPVNTDFWHAVISSVLFTPMCVGLTKIILRHVTQETRDGVSLQSADSWHGTLVVLDVDIEVGHRSRAISIPNELVDSVLSDLWN